MKNTNREIIVQYNHGLSCWSVSLVNRYSRTQPSNVRGHLAETCSLPTTDWLQIYESRRSVLKSHIKSLFARNKAFQTAFVLLGLLIFLLALGLVGHGELNLLTK